MLGDIDELISVSLGPWFPHLQMKVRVQSDQENPDMHKEFLPSAWLFEVPHQSLVSVLDVRRQELPVFSLCHLGFTSRSF